MKISKRMAIKLHFTNKKIVNNILFNINLVRIHQYNRFFIEIIKQFRVKNHLKCIPFNTQELKKKIKDEHIIPNINICNLY